MSRDFELDTPWSDRAKEQERKNTLPKDFNKEKWIASILSVVFYDMRGAAGQMLNELLANERNWSEVNYFLKGWRLVPRKPTVSMHNAAAMRGLVAVDPKIKIGETGELRLTYNQPDPTAIYLAMLDATPPPPSL